MSKPCIICDRDTNTGICAICKIDGRELPQSKDETSVIASETKQSKNKIATAAPHKEKNMNKKSYLCSTKECGRAMQKDGLCYICYKAKYGKAPYPKHKEKDITESKPSITGYTKICLRCKKDYLPTGFNQKHCKDCKKEIKREIDRKYKKQKRTQVSPGTPALKLKTEKSFGDNIGMTGGKISEPENKPSVIASEAKQSKDIIATAMPHNDNNKAAYLGQLLYVSDLLDDQIESVLESGLVDTNILINLRKRIGEVLRGSIAA